MRAVREQSGATLLQALLIAALISERNPYRVAKGASVQVAAATRSAQLPTTARMPLCVPKQKKAANARQTPALLLSLSRNEAAGVLLAGVASVLDLVLHRLAASAF